jgi:hypothetical protein
MAKIIESLTQEQKDRFPEFVKKWTDIGLSTRPADRQKAEQAVKNLYKLAELKEPKIFWLSDPLKGSQASMAFYLSIEVLKTIDFNQFKDVKNSAVDSAVNSAVDSAVYSAVDSAVSSAVDSAVDSAVSSAVDSAVSSAVYSAVSSAVYSAVSSAVDSAVSSAVYSAVYSAVNSAVNSAVDSAVDSAVYSAVHSAVHSAVNSSVNSAVSSANKNIDRQKLRDVGMSCIGGSLWAGYGAWADYLNQVLDIKIDRNYLDMIESCGYYFCLDGVVFMTERPSMIHRDDLGRLHNPTGPAIEYNNFTKEEIEMAIKSFKLIPDQVHLDANNRPHNPSGPAFSLKLEDPSLENDKQVQEILKNDSLKIYAWHGIEVPLGIAPTLIDHPENLTIDFIDKINNMELRRIAIERFGFDRYATQGKFNVLHQEFVERIKGPKGGKVKIKQQLIQKTIDGDEPLTGVYAPNASPNGRYEREERCMTPITNWPEWEQKNIIRKYQNKGGLKTINGVLHLEQIVEKGDFIPDLDENGDYIYKMYFMPCHPEIRPFWFKLDSQGKVELDRDGDPVQQFGEKQEATCQNALASTFGLYGDEYQLSVES